MATLSLALRALWRRVPRAADDGREAPRRDPRVLAAFRALAGGPTDEQVAAAATKAA